MKAVSHIFLIAIFFSALNQLNAQFSEYKEISKSFMYSLYLEPSDIDNDGDVDLICGRDDGYNFFWFENDGTGMTWDFHKFNTGHSTLLAADEGDIDGDLDIDFICANYDNSIVWFENIGGGNFNTGNLIIDNLIWPGTVKLADIDNDGDLDILASSMNDNKIVYYINDGTGNFGNQLLLGISEHVLEIESKDLNGDGNNDVIAASQSTGELFWYRNSGNGWFYTKQIISDLYYSAEYVQIFDVDNDSDNDILAFLNSILIIFENDGNGGFTEHQIESTSFWFTGDDVSIVDINNDFLPDVLVRMCYDETYIYTNTGSITFSKDTLDTQDYLWGSNVVSADFNNDNLNDIILTQKNDGSLSYFPNQGNGIFDTSFVVLESDYDYFTHIVADIDFDGDMDFITGYFIYENTGNEIFVRNDFYIPESGYISIGDFDNDSDYDILGTDINNMYIYENLGNFNFSTGTLIDSTANGNRAILSVDFDNDNDIDIISGDRISKELLLFENDGSGNFNAPMALATLIGDVRNICQADFENDGDIDFVTCEYNYNGSPDKICSFTNTGGAFVKYNLPVVGDDHNFVTVSDLNGDGYKDIIAASDENGTVCWYKNNGSNIFNNSYILDTTYGGYAHSVASLDFDGDNDYDVFASYDFGYTSGIKLFENLGSGNFSESIFDTFNIPQSMVIYDLNQDGTQDLLTKSFDGLGWYENYGDSRFKIKGKIFFDENEDGIKNQNEYGFNLMGVDIQPAGLGLFTNAAGEYVCAVDSGNYSVSINVLNNWYITSPYSMYNVNVNSLSLIVDTCDFGLFPSSFIDDIDVSLTSGIPRCNFNVPQWVCINNLGTTHPSGVVEYTLDYLIDFVNSVPAPDSIVGSVIYWHFDSLNYFQSNSIQINVNMPSAAYMGTLLTSYVNAFAKDSSGNTLCVFTDTLSETLLCSYDPNDKIVSPSGEGFHGYVPSDQELTYTVRFQNTGNDTAINILIIDNISENLDISTLTPVSSSHSMNLIIESDRDVLFKLDSIMLPDSNVNVSGSQGYIKYRINVLSGLLPNTPITNKADIFFDYNPAIETNITLNTVECYISPPIPIITENSGILSVTGNNNVQWYQDGDCLFGETDTVFVPEDHGYYTVAVMNEFGCITISDPYDYLVKINKNQSKNITIYPNPSDGEFNFICDESLIEEFMLFDITGSCLMKVNNINSGKYAINLQSFESGVYFGKLIISNGNLFEIKLVLQ